MLIAFNKPHGVICQFSPSGDKPTLKDYIDVPDVYPAGRLDTDSEGLLLLTDDGVLQARIADPTRRLVKVYWVQVEGEPTDLELLPLRKGVVLHDFITAPAEAKLISPPSSLWPRNPPVRVRKNIPVAWLQIGITEGKNRQIRRMTAKIGYPTLRLVRIGIGTWTLDGLAPGKWQAIAVPASLRQRTKFV
jgi:23S rRNA pseudouridine2457 synthase